MLDKKRQNGNNMNSKEIGISAISGIIKVIVIIILLVVFVRLGQVGYDYGYQVFNQKAVSTGEGKSVTVTIKEGESIAELANDLKEKGLIERTETEKVVLTEDNRQVLTD